MGLQGTSIPEPAGTGISNSFEFVQKWLAGWSPAGRQEEGEGLNTHVDSTFWIDKALGFFTLDRVSAGFL